MNSIEARANTGKHPIRTTKELSHVIGANLSILNLDVNNTREMPSISPGEQGFTRFVGSLRASRLENLADAFEVVHDGEKRSKKGKNFPNEDMRKRYLTTKKVIDDMSITVGANASILNNHSLVRAGTYSGQETKNGELVLTFYELMLELLSDPKRLPEPVTYVIDTRARTLSQQASFTSSPLMERVMDSSRTSAAEIIRSL